jgi:hypothetical protein
MRIGIVGGVLQGMEATYLAKKAGMETLAKEMESQNHLLLKEVPPSVDDKMNAFTTIGFMA